MRKIKNFFIELCYFFIVVIFLFLSIILESIYEDFDKIESTLKWPLVFAWGIFLVLLLRVAFNVIKEKK